MCIFIEVGWARVLVSTIWTPLGVLAMLSAATLSLRPYIEGALEASGLLTDGADVGG